MKKIYSFILLTLCTLHTLSFAQQLPNAGFEDWSGAAFNGNPQPKDWNASNVTQFSFKFNFAHKEAGHTGEASMMVQDQEVGAAGITEVSPGYFSLGQPWVYVKSLTTVNQATAGTEGGINWTYRPDTMSVWIKRTGKNVDKEDFYLLYYAWSGTAQSSKYKGKDGKCTSVSKTNEESDIRQALDGNECGTDQKATQIAEGMWREKKEYGEWTNIRVPIYYFNSDAPTMMNIIFSASNYPNFRANSGLNAGNSLYVDDVELIYSSSIQKLYIDGKEWKGFNPNSTDEQIYSLGREATALPSIKAVRGAGSLTNAAGTTVPFSGRELSGSEISIIDGVIDGAPTTITVQSEDGSSTSTYKIRFVREASTNAKLAGIYINGQEINKFGATFNPNIYAYTAKLPYGTSAIPQITAEGQEDAQTISITQASALDGTATIRVIAADKKTVATYTVQLQVALLADNTLKDILVNGEPLPGFVPSQTIYTLSLPTSTTTMPAIKAVSAYPDGEQTIEYVVPKTIDGGKYQIKVTTPGNMVPKTYTLHIKLEASTYSLLKSLQVGNGLISDFAPEQTTYYVNLPIGTTELPEITFVKGESTQQVTIQQGGLDGVTRVSVLAGDGISQTEYKIVFSTAKSEISTLKMIYVGGEPLEGFTSGQNTYSYVLPIGTTALPEITFEKGDEYQTVSVLTNGINGTTRITVVAGNGNSTLYQIAFSVKQATDASLKMIYVDDKPLQDFDAETLEYNYSLPQGTTVLPAVTYDPTDEYQTITVRSGGINGDYKITVRPQNGASRTYVLHFSVATSDNADLKMIYVDGKPLSGFAADKLQYVDSLPVGVSTLPSVTYDKAEDGQRVLSVCTNNIHTIKVTAESGRTQTYTIQFILRRSESAYLKMIYLNGDSLIGFDKQKLTYQVSLFDATCPVITVDKEDGQQITITTPYAAGRAEIVVKPESAASNTYIIDFLPVTNNKALLNNIYINGEPLNGYQSTVFEYTLSTVVPAITFDNNADQHVSIFRQKDDVTIFVVAGTDKVQYTLHLNHALSADCTLRSILLDNKQLTDFSPKTLQYTVSLPAGSTLPEVSFLKQHDEQVVYAGLSNSNLYNLLVVAANGDTARYQLHFDIAEHNNANLIDMQVVGHDIHFTPTTYDYNLSLPAGLDLPTLLIKTDIRQSTEMHTVSDEEQQVIVTAQSGLTRTYRVRYTRIRSSNALLTDILVGGKSLKDFQSDRYAYTDTLEWRTKVIPCVQPIGQEPNNQSITTYHSAINGTTLIHVEAADGTTQEYSIAFPVRQSSNVALSNILLNSETVSIDFNAETTDYQVQMPYGETAAPMIMYEASEPEQRIQYISRPLGQTSQIIVTAENGDTRTYNLTFLRTYSTAANRLASLKVIETGQMIDIQQSASTITLPYGTRNMTVAFEKTFPEQSVWVQPGGIYAPTVITVRSNRPDEDDFIYTLTPQLSTQNPAVLTSINVNGVTLPDFDPNRFTYVVDLPSGTIPAVSYAPAAGVTVTKLSSRFWQASVTNNGYTNNYTLVFHYPNDIIPNNEFTEWTKATKRTSADKPVSWQVAADYADSYGLPAATTGTEVLKEEGIVHMKTSNLSTYLDWAGGGIPSVLTLGNIHFSWGTSGKTKSTFNGNIPFYNTPDSVTIRYHYAKKAGNGALFAFRFFDTVHKEHREHAMDYIATETTSDYVIYTHALATDALELHSMNIAINATNQEDHVSMGADLYVDYLRFIYNSRLSGILVNGESATRNSDAFTYTLTDPEYTQLPSLTFIGEVSDQAQQITWQDEVIDGAFGVRTASIINYAEDGTHTDYTLTLRRPLDTRNTLSDLLLDGTTIQGFSPTTTDYTIHLSYNYPITIHPQTASSLQTVVSTFADSTYTITVTPESGEPTIYSIRFVTDLSDDVQLASIVATGISFLPEQTEYEVVADQLPAIKFVKKMDDQTVNLHDSVLTVTAENGHVGTYTIHLRKPERVTTAQLAMLEFDDIEWQAFNSDNYDYTAERPNRVAFSRLDATDSVIFVQTPTLMQWQVFGTADQHTYTLTYPTDLSSDTRLQTVLYNGKPLADFDRQVFTYTIRTDSAVQLQAIANPDSKQLSVSREATGNGFAYIFTVTAEDGTIGTPYRVDIQPNLLSTPYLRSITLDDTQISDFRADNLVYHIVLPSAAYKTTEPTLPSLHYELGAPRQQVSIEHGTLGQATYLNVTSEDGTQTAQYEIVITAEPSHCVELDGIAVNGEPIAHFDPTRHYYSVRTAEQDVLLAWSSKDHFQTVTQSSDDATYTLHVVAQDGTTSADYIIEVYRESASDDATLADILLDGQSFTEFHNYLNPSLGFAPMQQLYTIHLPAGTTSFPVVSATMKEDGQTATMRQEGQWIYIDVTAPDLLTTNTYKLLFDVRKSSNATLKMIYISGDSLSAFEPDRYTYFITLPIGQDAIPDVYAEPAESTQTVRDSVTGDLQKTIYVTAEDGTTHQYLLAFSRTLSQADTLQAIYADGQLITGFAPRRFYYAYTLPVGTNHIPDLTWDEADKWQTVTTHIIEQTATALTTQITVTAMSGHRNTYLVSYQIEQSAIDTLRMIYVQADSLRGFSGRTTDYSISLMPGDSVMPTVTWLEGDDYQHVTTTTEPYILHNQQIGWKQTLLVEAQNSHSRTYTLLFTFSPVLSTEVGLRNIYLSGEPLSGFTADRFTYIVPLTEEQPLPTVFAEQLTLTQTVTIQTGDTTRIFVTAEDTTQHTTYTLIFRRQASPYSLLAALYQDGTLLQGFRPDSFEYDVLLPYGTTTLPMFTYDLGKEGQTITIDTIVTTINQRTQTVLRLIVTAPDPMYSSEYDIRILTALSSNCRLSDLRLRGTTIAHFHADTLHYDLIYPIDTDSSVLAQLSDLQAVAEDPQAIVRITPTDVDFTIQVDAPDGQTSRIYTISQRILLSDNARLQSITLDDQLLHGFDPDILEYTYYITDAQPLINAVPEDTTAQVDFSMFVLNEPFHIYVTAADGSEMVYTIYFLESTLQSAQTPNAHDVLVKHVPGTKDLIFATLRKNVSVAVYSDQGSLIFRSDVPESDQNDATVIINTEGSETLIDVRSTYVQCMLPDANLRYVYVFYENGKRRIASGKLSVTQ